MDIEGEGPNLALLKLLVLTNKKLAFKFNTYIFEYRSLPTYKKCTSTHVMNAPRPSLFIAGFPLFCIIVTEGKMEEDWERGYYYVLYQ